MNNQSKKSKNKTKSTDDNFEAKPEKKVGFRDSNISDNSQKEEDEFQKKESTRRRKHTKVSKKSKGNNLESQILEDQSYKGKKVKFSKIDVIDVESWKKLNLKLTAEENMDELMKISEGKKERIKNVSCSCMLI